MCLLLGGPPSFVNASCGELVPARDARNELELSQRFADAIARVFSSSEHWLSLHKGAIQRAAEMTWEKQIEHIQAKIREALR